MHKRFVPHNLNHVRLLRQKQNILRDLFINISSIVGVSRRTSCIFFTYIHTDEYHVPRDLNLQFVADKVFELRAIKTLNIHVTF